MWTVAGQMQPPPSPSYRPRTTPVAEEHGGSRNFDGVDEGGSDDVGGDEGGSDDVGGDRTTDEEAIEEVERRSEHVHARGDRGGGGGAVVSTCMQEAIEEEERFLMDQYGPRMHPVPLSSVSPRPPGQGHSPPTHVHSPRRRHNAGRAAASPAGGTLSQQVVCFGAAIRSSNEKTSGSLLMSQYRFSPGARAENAAAQAPCS